MRAGAQAIDRILAHPSDLEKAQGVAIDLDQAMQHGTQQRVDELRCTLRHFIYEALRFRPMLPLLLRDTPRETVIAYGTKEARIVRAGTRVIAPPLAAMFDPEVFPDPQRFDPRRPFECYLHFGYGLRQCFGQYIAETVLLEIFRSLLVLPDLSRAAGTKGLGCRFRQGLLSGHGSRKSWVNDASKLITSLGWMTYGCRVSNGAGWASKPSEQVSAIGLFVGTNRCGLGLIRIQLRRTPP